MREGIAHSAGPQCGRETSRYRRRRPGESDSRTADDDSEEDRDSNGGRRQRQRRRPDCRGGSRRGDGPPTVASLRGVPEAQARRGMG